MLDSFTRNFFRKGLYLKLDFLYGSSALRLKPTESVVVTDAFWSSLQNFFINRNLHLLHMDQEVKKVFTRNPVVSFRSARKLSSYLVRAKLYPLERKVSSFKCKGKRC